MKFFQRLRWGYVPEHEGWEPGEAAQVAAEVRKASERLHKCGNLKCKSHPLKGSMFCYDCLEAPKVRVVTIRPKRLRFTIYKLHRIVQALEGLERLTTAWFTQLEVQFSVQFDEALVGTGTHHTG